MNKKRGWNKLKLAVQVLIGMGMALGVAACSGSADLIPEDTPPLPKVTLLPTPTIQPALGTPVPAAVTTSLAVSTLPTPRIKDIYDGQWRLAKPGIEVMHVIGEVGERKEALILARVNPAQVTVQIRYAQQSPRRVREWYLADEADLVINGGYYSPENQALGLLISEKQSFGQSYRGFGGMFAVHGNRLSLQWLKTQPYQADKSIDYALQCFPMLVTRGKVVEGIQDNGEQNRRSFVALDRQGRIIFGVTQAAQWTLTDLARYLQRNPELNLVEALNLDGGASTGLWVRGIDDAQSMDSFDEVPVVIEVKSV